MAPIMEVLIRLERSRRWSVHPLLHYVVIETLLQQCGAWVPLGRGVYQVLRRFLFLNYLYVLRQLQPAKLLARFPLFLLIVCVQEVIRGYHDCILSGGHGLGG